MKPLAHTLTMALALHYLLAGWKLGFWAGLMFAAVILALWLSTNELIQRKEME